MLCKRILFVIDTPEAFSAAVLRKVARVAAGFDAEVEVFDTVFDSAVVDCAKVHEATERRRAELEPIVDVLQGLGARAQTKVRWVHPPRDGIAQEIDAYQPDLLILKSGKHTFLERMLFTYSDYKLIETAQCPILVIKSGRAYADARVIAAVDPMHAHDKPAELDRHIVGAAIAIATALKLPVHLFHACSQLPPGLPTDKPLRQIPQAVYEDICGIWQAKTRARVSALAESAGIPAERVHITIGNPGTVLPQFVSGDKADLLVMGAVSRSWFTKALIGYTAEKVMHATDCDLLIVKPPAIAAPQEP